jgi:hypothetical protein
LAGTVRRGGFGGAHLPQPQALEQVRVPEPEKHVGSVHDPVRPGGVHSNPSSVLPSASSSHALQTSVRVHELQREQSEAHVWLPVSPQTVQVLVDACTQVNASSVAASQSSSRALQVSAGGVQAAASGISQAAVQVPCPTDAQAVVQETVEPARQVKPSSAVVSQSSSTPSQVSRGATQAAPVGMAQESVQTPVPVERQVVMQSTVRP